MERKFCKVGRIFGWQLQHSYALPVAQVEAYQIAPARSEIKISFLPGPPFRIECQNLDIASPDQLSRLARDWRRFLRPGDLPRGVLGPFCAAGEHREMKLAALPPEPDPDFLALVSFKN